MSTALLNNLAFSEHDLIRSITRENFYEFVQEFWDTIIPEDPVWNWHIEYLCNELQYIAHRVFRKLPKEYDLVINVPPGSTKSTICSVMFPAWVWANMPTARIIGASYSGVLAMDLSMKNRDVVTSEKYVKTFGQIEVSETKKKDWVKIRIDQQAKSFFATTRGGARYSVGVGGSITGRHGHFILVDDPLDPKEAVSEVTLKTANRWMNETLPTRKVDKRVTPTILIMQRLHQNDPTNLLLEKMKEGGSTVKHICLPAEESDKIKPEEVRSYYKMNGGLLDPVRLPKKVLKENRVELGEYGYAGQFEQHPVPLGGGMFKWEKIQIEFPEFPMLKEVRFWDKAATADGGAYSSGVKMGEDKRGRIWILDVKRGQWSTDKRESIIRLTARADGHSVSIGIEQEPGSGGKDSALYTIRNLRGFKAVAERPTGAKEVRAIPFSDQVNVGNVWMVPGEWNNAYLNEMEYFPHSTYMDQIDASSGAFKLLTRRVIKITAR